MFLSCNQLHPVWLLTRPTTVPYSTVPFFASDTNCYQKSISQKNVQFKHAVSVKYGCLNTPLGIACTCLNTCTHNLRARTFTGMLACTLTCSPARSHVHSPACFRLRVFKVIFGSKYRLKNGLNMNGSYYLRAGGGWRRRTKGSVVGEEWCQNAAPLRWYTKNVFAQSKMILSRAWLHDTVSCAAWNDARKGVYLKPLFKTPCSNCYWGWSKPIMLGLQGHLPYGECASNVEARDRVTRGNWTHDHFRGGGAPPLIIDIQYITARIPRLARAGPPIPLYACAEARRTQVADATFRDKPIFWLQIWPEKRTSENAQVSERVSTQVNRWAYRCTHLYQHVRMQVCMWARMWFHIHSFTVQHTPPHITTPFCLIPCLAALGSLLVKPKPRFEVGSEHDHGDRPLNIVMLHVCVRYIWVTTDEFFVTSKYPFFLFRRTFLVH